MPLDDTTKHYEQALAPQADPLDYRTFTPGPEGLRKLAWVLRHPEVWPRGHVWSYTCHGRCAMGIAHQLWPEIYDGMCGFVATGEMTKAFGIPKDSAERLFIWQHYGSSAADIAAAIDSYLARAESSRRWPSRA